MKKLIFILALAAISSCNTPHEQIELKREELEYIRELYMLIDDISREMRLSVVDSIIRDFEIRQGWSLH